MSAASSPLSSPTSAPKIPKLKWKTAKENASFAGPMVKDNTWLLTHVLHCPNNTAIRIRVGNRKYALSANKEAFFDDKKKVVPDLVQLRNNR